jgi:hypothetical protein
MNTKTEELASLYVLDELNLEERQAFEKRLQSDTELLLLVRELELALEDQIRSLPQHSAPSHLFNRIKDRIEAVPAAEISQPMLTLRWSTLAGWGMAAALLLGVGLTLLVTSRDPAVSPVASQQPVVLIVGMNSDSSVVKHVPATMAVDEFENFTQLAEMAETYWAHPDELPGNLGKSPLANTLGSGYAVYDPRSKYGFVAIQNLPLHQEGKNYFLWLKDAGSKVLECAGIIPLQDRKQGLYFFELDGKSSINSNKVTFFITEEEAADAELSHPKGQLVLGSDRI